MTDKPYPNELLTEIANQIVEWELTPEEIRNLAADLPREVASILEEANQRAWERWTSREPDDSAYRTDMINAGRGHLLR
jgi:uncharacterized protein (DUF2267 family)